MVVALEALTDAARGVGTSVGTPAAARRVR
jgi:hypothetical protein